MPKFLRKLEFEKVIKALWDGAKDKFVEEITFDNTIDTATNKPKNTLKQNKNSQETVVVDHVVTEWMDLDYTTQSSIKNIFDKNTQVEEDKVYSFNNISTDTGCRIVKIPCSAGDTFTIVKSATLDSKQVGVYNANGNHIHHLDANGKVVNGKAVYRFTIPGGLQDSSYFVNSMYKAHVDINEVMVFKENVADNNIPTNYVPFTDGATVLIDSSEVALSFDRTGTNLSSATIHSAIKELDEKVDRNILPITDCQPINQFNGREMVLGKRYDDNGDMVSDAYYATYDYPCTAGQTFTIAKRIHDNDRCVYLTQDNQKVQATTIPRYTINEIVYYRVTVPNDNTIAKIGFNIKTTVNTTQVMIFDGHNNLPVGATFTPYLAEKLIDGDKVLHSFNNVGTNLSSTTTKEAMEELSLSKVDKYTTTFNRHKSYRDFTAKYYRIPSLLATPNGTLLAFSDIRYNGAGDQTFIDIGVARSIDNGLLWNNAIAMKNDRVNETQSRVMDSTSVVTETGKIILLAGGWKSGGSNWTQSTQTPTDVWNPYIVTSDDDGLSWSEKISLKAGSPNACANQPQGTVAWLGGVGTGIVVKNGNHRNRIVLPIQICVRENNSNKVKAGCIYSDDDGVTWTMSNVFAPNGTSENMIAEIDNGDLIMIARIDNRRSKGAYISTDGGDTWSEYADLHGKFTHGTPSCQGSWITVEINGQTIGLLSHPKNNAGTYQRDNITIYMYNFNNPTQGVVELYTVYPYLGNGSGAGYSSLCYYKSINGVNKLAILFETNGNIEFKDISEVVGIIEKTQGVTVTGSVASVNGQTPVQGNVTIDASHINMINGTKVEDAINSKADASDLNDNVARIDSELSELSNTKVDKYTSSFASDLMVESLKVIGSHIKHSGSSLQVSLSGNRTLTGDKATSVTQGTNITMIQIGLEGYSEGETVTGVEVYAVNKDTDTIVECIAFNKTGVARKPKSSTFNFPFVDVEVNKSFGEEIYFIVGLRRNNGKGMRLGGHVATGIAFDKTSEDKLQVGSTITLATTRVPFLYIYGDGLQLDKILEIDNKVDRSEVGNEANKIPVIDGTGKLATSIMPDIAITDVIVIQDVSDIMNQNVQVGDVVVVENEGNKTYMCKNEQGQNKNDKFIEINMGTPVVKKLNGLLPSNTGELEIKGNQIPVSNTITTSISEELEKCVRTVNNQAPIGGNVTINAAQINGVYNNAGNLQSHLNTIKSSIDTVTSRANENANKITKLETKVPTVKVGDIVSTFEDSGSQYVVGGVTYLYIGQTRTVQHSTYPQLASALGISGATNYQLPVISDTSYTFDNGQRRRNRKHYIVAHISS